MPADVGAAPGLPARPVRERYLEQGLLVTDRPRSLLDERSRAHARVEALWEELALPARDRDFFRGRFFGRTDSDSDAKLREQLELLLEHRTAVITTLHTIASRQRSRAQLKAYYEALRARLPPSSAQSGDLPALQRPRGGPRRQRELAEEGAEKASRGRQTLDAAVKKLGGDAWVARARAALAGAVRDSCAVLESVERWRRTMWRPRGFLWRGDNYLLTMASDCAFLASDVGTRFLSALGLGPANVIALIPAQVARHRPVGKPGGVLDSARDRDRFREAAATLLAEPECVRSLAKERRELTLSGVFVPVLRWAPGPSPSPLSPLSKPQGPPTPHRPVSPSFREVTSGGFSQPLSPKRWAEQRSLLANKALRENASQGVRGALAAASALRELREDTPQDGTPQGRGRGGGDPGPETSPEMEEADKRALFEAAADTWRAAVAKPVSPKPRGREGDLKRAATALTRAADLQARVRLEIGAAAFQTTLAAGQDERSLAEAEEELRMGVVAAAEFRLKRRGCQAEFRAALRARDAGNGDPVELEKQAARMVQLWWELRDVQNELEGSENVAHGLRRRRAARVIQRLFLSDRWRRRRASVLERAAVDGDVAFLAKEDPGAAASALQHWRRDAAAAVIGCAARRVLRRRAAALALQVSVRRFLSRLHVEQRLAAGRRRRRVAAARSIQRKWRRFHARRRWQWRRREVASRALQGWWRRQRALRRAQLLLVERERSQEDAAVTVIQIAFREWRDWRSSLGKGERPRRKGRDWFTAFEKAMVTNSPSGSGRRRVDMQSVVSTFWKARAGASFLTRFESRKLRWASRGGSVGDAAAHAIQDLVRRWLRRRDRSAGIISRVLWRRLLQLNLRAIRAAKLQKDRRTELRRRRRVYQAVARAGWPGVWEFQQARRHALRVLAATTIQSAYRGGVGRQVAAPLRARRVSGATSLQRLWRGHQGRKYAAIHRRAVEERRAAILALQCAMRVSRAMRLASKLRHEYNAKKLAVTLVQAHARRWAARHMLRHLRERQAAERAAALTLATWWRHVLLARGCDRALWAWRRWNELLQERAVQVQCSWRCHVARGDLARRKAVLSVQCAWRCALARRVLGERLRRKREEELRRQTAAAIVVQARWRGWSGKRRFAVVRRGLIRLQSRARGAEGRRYVASIRANVARLQMMFRALAAKRRFDELRAAIPRPMRVRVSGAGSFARSRKRLVACVQALDPVSGERILEAFAPLEQGEPPSAELLLPGVDGRCTLRVILHEYSKLKSHHAGKRIGFGQAALIAKPNAWRLGTRAMLPLTEQPPAAPSAQNDPAPPAADHLGSPLSRAMTRKFTERVMRKSQASGPAVELAVVGYRVPDTCGYVQLRAKARIGRAAHWESHWCVLAGDQLLFFKEYGHTDVQHAMLLDHSTSVDVVGANHTIHVESNKEKVLMFVEDPADRSEWVFAIGRVVR